MVILFLLTLVISKELHLFLTRHHNYVVTWLVLFTIWELGLLLFMGVYYDFSIYILLNFSVRFVNRCYLRCVVKKNSQLTRFDALIDALKTNIIIVFIVLYF